MVVRLCKAVMVLCLSLFVALLAVDTYAGAERSIAAIQEAGSVGAADRVAAALRVLADPAVAAAVHWARVGAEALAALLLLLGGLRLLQRARATVDGFQSAKALTAVGATVGVLVWIVGGSVIGGAWVFSPPSAGAFPGAALPPYVPLLLVTLLVLQPDTELPSNQTRKRRTLI